ncbi:MAG: DUF504 domain-containing protein [Candidatus Altiarchaeales archaeon]|nr:DUF504 domain-containing protein [Candidatus Altiarchaeales archaeon]
MDKSGIKRLFEKEKLEKDVLNRLLWDKKLDGKDFTVGYADRFKSRLAEIPYSEITLGGDFFRHKESLIPMHRIREVKYRGAVVWAKRKKD